MAWQYIFLVALPGLLVVLLMLTVREPARQETSSATENLSFREVLTFLHGRREIYVPLFLGMSVNTIVAMRCSPGYRPVRPRTRLDHG